ncbi:hypothetical protein IAR50_001345 [Cryptococcus sp. DSM 104548]
MPLKRKITAKKKKGAKKSHQPASSPPSPHSPTSSRATSPTPASPPAKSEPAQTFQPFQMTPTKESFEASLRRATADAQSMMAPLEAMTHATGPGGPLELTPTEKGTPSGRSITDAAPTSPTPPAKPQFSQAYYMAMALLPPDLKKYIEEVTGPDVDGILDEDGAFHPSRFEPDQPAQPLLRRIAALRPTVQQAFLTAYQEKMRMEGGPAFDLFSGGMGGMGKEIGMGGMGALGVGSRMGSLGGAGAPKQMLGGNPERIVPHHHSNGRCTGHPNLSAPTYPAPPYHPSASGTLPGHVHPNELGIDFGRPSFGSGLLPPPHMLFSADNHTNVPLGSALRNGDDDEKESAAISERKKKKNGKRKEKYKVKRIGAQQAGEAPGEKAEKASEEEAGKEVQVSTGICETVNSSTSLPDGAVPTIDVDATSPSSASEEVIVTPLVKGSEQVSSEAEVSKVEGKSMLEEKQSAGVMEVPDIKVIAEPISKKPQSMQIQTAAESAATYIRPPASPEILASRKYRTTAGRSLTFTSVDKMPDIKPVASPRDEPLPPRRDSEPSRPSLPTRRRSSGTTAGRSLTFSPVEELQNPLDDASDSGSDSGEVVRVKDQVGYDDLWEEEENDDLEDVEASLAATAPLTVITEEEEAMEEGEIREKAVPTASALQPIPEVSREDSVTPSAGVKADPEVTVAEEAKKQSPKLSVATTIPANASFEPPSTAVSPVPSDSTEVEDQPATIYRIPSELSGRRGSEPLVGPTATPAMERSQSWGPSKPVFKVQGRPEIALPSLRQDRPMSRPGVLERTMSTPTGVGLDSRHSGLGERMAGALGLRRNNSIGLGGWSRTSSANTSPDRSRRGSEMGSFGRPQGGLVYTDRSPVGGSPLLPAQQLPSHAPSTRPDMAHLLARPWTLYFSDSSEKAASQQSAREYDSGLIKVFSAACVEDLLGSWKALRRAIAYSKGRDIEPEGEPLQGGGGLGMWLMGDDTNFHLFADGIKPMWEDPTCAKGGKLMMAGDAHKMDEVFLELCLLMIGGDLEVGISTPPRTRPVVCGASISRRKTTTRIEVWLGGRDVPDKRWISDVHDRLSNYFSQIRVLPYKSFHRH